MIPSCFCISTLKEEFEEALRRNSSGTSFRRGKHAWSQTVKGHALRVGSKNPKIITWRLVNVQVALYVRIFRVYEDRVRATRKFENAEMKNGEMGGPRSIFPSHILHFLIEKAG